MKRVWGVGRVVGGKASPTRWIGELAIWIGKCRAMPAIAIARSSSAMRDVFIYFSVFDLEQISLVGATERSKKMIKM